MATKKPTADIAYLCRALKAPSLAQAVARLAERARADNWTHEEFLAACLDREVAARQSNGGELRIRAARFPARKTLEDFDFDHQRSLKRDVVAQPLRTSLGHRHQQQTLRTLGRTFGDDTVAAAMIDRLVHHAEVV